MRFALADLVLSYAQRPKSFAAKSLSETGKWSKPERQENNLDRGEINDPASCILFSRAHFAGPAEREKSNALFLSSCGTSVDGVRGVAGGPGVALSW